MIFCLKFRCCKRGAPSASCLQTKALHRTYLADLRTRALLLEVLELTVAVRGVRAERTVLDFALVFSLIDLPVFAQVVLASIPAAVRSHVVRVVLARAELDLFVLV